MNKYQRVVNQIAKLRMNDSRTEQLLKNREIKNTFRNTRKLVKLYSKHYFYDGLLEIKNIYRGNLTNGN